MHFLSPVVLSWEGGDVIAILVPQTWLKFHGVELSSQRGEIVDNAFLSSTSQYHFLYVLCQTSLTGDVLAPLKNLSR